MANRIFVPEQDGTPKQIVFGDVGGDFSPTAANDLRVATSGNRTNVQITLASLADGAARQSDKADLGVLRASLYVVRAAFEFAATPTAGDAVLLYWGESAQITTTGNLAALSGSDGAYAGVGSDLDRSCQMLTLIGRHLCTDDPTATVQASKIGYLVPGNRYGSLVVRNESGAAFHSDDVEIHVVFDPIFFEVQ